MKISTLLEYTKQDLDTWYKIALKNISAELKKQFPDTKFSIKTLVDDMGKSMKVYWNDGPSEVKVSYVVDKYKLPKGTPHYTPDPKLGGARVISIKRTVTDKMDKDTFIPTGEVHKSKPNIS